MQITVAKLRPCYRVTRVSSRAALTAMSCASSAATWALTCSRSPSTTHTMSCLSVTVRRRHGTAQHGLSHDAPLSRVASVTSCAPPRAAPRGPLPIPAPPAHPRAPMRPLSPTAPAPLLAAVPVRGSSAVIAVRSLLATRVPCSLYQRFSAAYSHSRTLLRSQTQWNSFISASFVCRKSSQWLCCNDRASFTFRSAASPLTAAFVLRDEKPARAP